MNPKIRNRQIEKYATDRRRINRVIVALSAEELRAFMMRVCETLYLAESGHQGIPAEWNLDREWDCPDDLGTVADCIPATVRAAIADEVQS